MCSACSDPWATELPPEPGVGGSPGEHEQPRVALVTGANRGIGREVVRQLAERGFKTLLGSRDPEKGAAAADELRREGLDSVALELDVSDADSTAGLAALVVLRPGGWTCWRTTRRIHYDTWQRGVDADLAVVSEALETNLLGAWRTTQACLPLLRDSAHGRIVNVSSGAGSLSDMGAGTPAYSVSKAALNALTRVLAAELRREANPRELRVPRLGGHRHGRRRRTPRGRRRGERDVGGHASR